MFGANNENRLARLEIELAHISSRLAGLESSTLTRVADLDRLTEMRFETFHRMLLSEAEKVVLSLSYADRAILKAEHATDKRFDAVNEFRQQLADQVQTFATRESVELNNASLRERIDTLTAGNRKLIEDAREERRVQIDEIKAQSGRIMFGLMSTVVGTLITALVLILTRN